MKDLKSAPLRALILIALGLICGPAAAADDAAAIGEATATIAPPDAPRAVEGRVFAQARPVAKATVYAYEVATYALKKVLTDSRGSFLFGGLPAGMYKIIAYKDGFAPTVSLLLRRRSEERQFVEIQMLEEQVGDVRQGEDYWSVRGRVPADVLRDIQSPWSDDEGAVEPGMRLAGLTRFEGEMLAQGGYEQLGGDFGEAQMTAAELALHGTFGALQVGLNGSFQSLVPSGVTGLERVPDAEVRSVAVAVESPRDSKLSVTTSSGQLAHVGDEVTAPVDLEHYQVQWSGRAGDKGRSKVKAQFIEEANYHQAGWVDPVAIPEASSTWNLEGSYTSELTRNTYLQAGLRYRQRSTEGLYLASLAADSLEADPGNDETIGVYGLAGYQILPRVLVEYGLYSSVRDGSLSLMPHGGMVVDLGSDWKARTSFARRMEASEPEHPYRGFSTASYGDDATCRNAGEACYEVFFSHEGAGDDSISLGAVHREYAETLRLYFSPDFFNRLESLFVVRGDELPELQFSMVRRIAPKVLARLESNIAAGGGGIFYATDDRPYENQVRYLVTSLDTRFQHTSTGVFVAFHHLEQQLNPMADPTGPTTREIEMQRLQVMLTQDLNVLADFASNWAVRFNVELSRGATPYKLTTDDELHKKLTGGISVSF